MERRKIAHIYYTTIGLGCLFSITGLVQQSTAATSIQDKTADDTAGSSDIFHFEPKDVWVAIVFGVIGFAGTHVTTIAKVKNDLKSQYDIDLRNKRIGAYRELWHALHLLRKHSRPPSIKYEDIKCLLGCLTYWYYKDGNGMFLTKASRDVFFDLVKAIEKAFEEDAVKGAVKVEKHMNDDVPGHILGKFPTETERGYGLLGIGSNLRTSLLDDIGTRARITGITYSGYKDE